MDSDYGCRKAGWRTGGAGTLRGARCLLCVVLVSGCLERLQPLRIAGLLALAASVCHPACPRCSRRWHSGKCLPSNAGAFCLGDDVTV